jgi:hypothetical protein
LRQPERFIKELNISLNGSLGIRENYDFTPIFTSFLIHIASTHWKIHAVFPRKIDASMKFKLRKFMRCVNFPSIGKAWTQHDNAMQLIEVARYRIIEVIIDKMESNEGGLK